MIKYIALFFFSALVLLSIPLGGDSNLLYVDWFHHFMGWDSETIHEKCREFSLNDSLLFRCYVEYGRPRIYFSRFIYVFSYLPIIYLAFSERPYIRPAILLFSAFLAFFHLSDSGVTSVAFLWNAGLSVFLTVVLISGEYKRHYSPRP